MSYESQYQLSQDAIFTQRVSACVTQESQREKGGANPETKAHAVDWLSGTSPEGVPSLLGVWMPIMAAEPGMADAPGGAESITDAQILASVQAQYPQISAMLYGTV